MDPMVVVSPHMDDAVLSMGQVLAGRPDAVVVSVFTGCPPKQPGVQTTYDRNCGFRSAMEAIQRRQEEDHRALAKLKATPVHLGYIDQQYAEVGLGEPDETDERIAGAIDAVLAPIQAEWPQPTIMLGPIGLKHPDHHRTRRAVQLAARYAAEQGRPVQLWVYEDAPARVLWPEDVAEALAWWRGMGWDPAGPAFMGTGPPEAKEAAVACYRSQLWALDIHAVLCPERLWRLWPCSS